MVGKNIKMMSEIFVEALKEDPVINAAMNTPWNSDYKSPFLSCFEKIPNRNRKWYQFWKPRMVKNPDYNPEPVEIDIVRGGE